jgi:hypothetical protein
MVFELKYAKPSERQAIYDKYAQQYGYSDRHIKRIAVQNGFVSGRKKRSDKGITTLAEEQIDFVGAFLRVTRRENKGAMAPVENAMEFAIDNGIMTRGEVSVGTMQRILREREMDKKRQNAPTPHTPMRSLHPNHVHEVDVSTCIQYYLDDGGVTIMRDDEFYKNKLQNFRKIKTTLQRYICEDHFSGFFFVKYYLADGETAENLFDFLCCAWETKSDARMPFQGVPKLLLGDGGTRAKAKALGVGFWEGIDVDIPEGTPGNSRRQGGCECHHNIWEMWFETRLRIDPATSIEELNRKAFGFCLWFNATRKHSRHEMTRLSCWLMIKQGELRILPARPELQDLLNKPEEERTVTNGGISFQGLEFSLRGFGIPHGAKVKVIKNLFKWKEGIVIVGYENNRFEARAIERLPAELGGFPVNAPIIGEQYKAQPQTATQKAAKRMDELAYGTDAPKRKEVPFYGMNAFEGFADKVDNLAVLPKRGTAIELARPTGPVSIPFAEFLKRVRDAIGRVTPELNRQLRAEYGESIDTKTAEEVIAQLARGEALSAASEGLKAEVGGL